MSKDGIDAVVEQICADEGFAVAVLRDGTTALEGGFDLTDDERTAVVAALRRDVEDAVGDVQGFLLPAVNMGMPSFAGIPFNNLSNLGRFRNSYEGSVRQIEAVEPE